MTTKKPLRLCVGDSKVSVFEKQLALIDSSALGIKSQKHAPAGYYSSSPFSNAGSSLYSSNISTLIDSPCENDLQRSKAGKSSAHKHKTQKNFERKNSIHLRIPLNLFIKAEKVITVTGCAVGGYLTSYTKEDIAYILDVISMFAISVWLTFGAEILSYKKDIFLSSIPLVLLCFLNLSLRYDSAVSKFTKIKSIESFHGCQKFLVQFLIGFQMMILCSLVRLTSVFKDSYLNDISRADNLVLIILGTFILGLTVSLFHYTFPLLFIDSIDGEKEQSGSTTKL